MYSQCFGLKYMGSKNEQIISQDWLSQLFREYSRELYWTALAFCSNKQMAEDAVQEAFLYLCEHPKAIENVSSVYAYLVRITKNYLIDQFRKQQLAQKHESNLTDEISFILEGNYTEEEYQEMLSKGKTLLDSLPEGCRRIFIKAIVEGMSYKEIAESENVSVNTVKTQLKIARKKLNSHTAILAILLIEMLK